jgi:PAS domain S-box-containing protein
MPIRFKIIGIFLLSALIPFFIIGALLYLDFRNTLEETAVNNLNTLASIQKNRVIKELDLKRERLHLLASSQTIIEQLNFLQKIGTSSAVIKNPAAAQPLSTITQSFLSTRDRITGYKQIYLVSLDGTVIASSDKDAVGRQVQHEPYYILGKKQEDISVLQKDEQGKVLQYLAGPIFVDGKKSAVIVIATDTKNIFDIFHDYTGLGQTGDWGLAKKDENGDGLIIVPKRMDTNPNSALESTVSKNNNTSPVIQGLSGKEVAITDGFDYRGEPILAVTLYIPDIQWMIGVTMESQEAYVAINELAAQLVFFGALLLIFIIFLGSFLSQIITAPIQKLSDTAAKLQAGNFDARAAITSRDEIGKLASIFNQMAIKLKEFYENLEQKVQDKTHELAEKITDLEQTKKATLNLLEDLNSEKAKDEALLASIGDGIIATDKNGNIIVINSSAEKMLGVTAGACIGKKWHEIIKMEDRYGKDVLIQNRPLHTALTTNTKISTTSTTPYYFVKKDGGKFPVVITATPVILQGEMIGGIEIFRDITIEQEIDRTKSEFVTLASHQLRTPISAISWFTEMLLAGDSGPLTAEQKEQLQQVYESNKRMATLVDALLNVSRLELGDFPIHPELVDLAHVSHKVLLKEMEEKGNRKSISLQE